MRPHRARERYNVGMCKGCLLGLSIEEYQIRYSDPFESGARNIAASIKGLKHIIVQTPDPVQKKHLHGTLRRLKAVAKELSQIRDDFAVAAQKDRNT